MGIDPLDSRSANDSPSRNSITRESTPSSWPTSYNAHTWGVGKARDRLCLTLQPLPELRVSRQVLGQHLEGHGPVEPRVPGLVHLAHAAGTNGIHDLIRTQPGPALERHRILPGFDEFI